MPTHQYVCPEGHITEQTQPIQYPVAKQIPCYYCQKDNDYPVPADWRPPSGIQFNIAGGGTGAQKGRR